jgi:hypothetical protein
MNQGTQGYSLTKKTEGRKFRDTVSLNRNGPKNSFIFLQFSPFRYMILVAKTCQAKILELSIMLEP